MFKTQDRLLMEKDGYNSLTQMTFDYSHLPSGKASYLDGVGSSGLGVNLTTENCNYDSQAALLKDQSQIIGSLKQSFINEKSQKVKTSQQQAHKTPKNYSLQLNQVVKKILSENHSNAGAAG
jgi:hypothetical protein